MPIPSPRRRPAQFLPPLPPPLPPPRALLLGQRQPRHLQVPVERVGRPEPLSLRPARAAVSQPVGRVLRRESSRSAHLIPASGVPPTLGTVSWSCLAPWPSSVR